MTTITSKVTRETARIYHRRPLVVTLHPTCLSIREKGRRDVVDVDFAVLYEFALKLRWRKAQSEKRAKHSL